MRLMRWVTGTALAGLLAGCSTNVPDSADGADAAPRGFAALFAPAEDKDAGDAAKDTTLPKPLSKVVMAGGDVVVAGPNGYCIDPQTAQTRGQRGFAMIASCHILSDGKIGSAAAPMLATVTVGARGGPDDLPSAQALAAASGAALRAGDTTDGLVAAQMATGGDALLDGGDPKHWRAAFVQSGRLVGLALYAPKGSRLAGPDGAAMLRRIKSAIMAASPKSDAVETSDADGVLGRLFNR